MTAHQHKFRVAPHLLQQEWLSSSLTDAEAFYWVSLVAASLALPFLWSWIEPSLLGGWWLSLLLLTLVGRALTQRARPDPAEAPAPQPQQDARRLALLQLGALCLGSVWAALLAWSLPALQHQPFAVGMLLCLWFAVLLLASSIYIYFFSVALAFTLPGLISLLLVSWTESQLFWSLLALPALAAVIFNAWHNRRLLRKMLAHQLQIAALLEEQQKQHSQLEDMVQQRTQELEAALAQHQHTSLELQQQRQRISQAIEASQLGLWDWDLDSDSIYHSHFSQIFGYAEDEIPHFMGHLQPLVHPDDYPHLRQQLIHAMKGQTRHFQCRFRIQHKTLGWRWIEDHGEVVERHPINGKAQRMLGTRRDVTEEQEKDDYLQLAWRAFEASSEATYIIDAESRIIFVNQAFVETTGYSRQAVLQQNFWQCPCFAREQATYKKIAQLLRQEPRWEGELIQERQNGESYPQWLRVVRVTSGYQSSAYTIGIFSDLTQKRLTEERLLYLAEYDELTGLANRAQFYDRLHQALGQARLSGQPLALLSFDVDRFKAYNNSLGHHVGDFLLKKIAERAAYQLPDAEILARTGGNEFAALLHADLDQALALAQDLMSSIHQTIHYEQHELRLTLSLGISAYPEHSHELQVLMNQADQARLRSKALGGHQVHVYNDAMRQSNLEQLHLEQELRLALEGQQLAVHFQPKLDLATQRISGVEALARWHHPEMGWIPPSAFIPLAERTGLIHQLGSWVLEAACAQAARWFEQGYSIQVAVNIAAQQIESGQLVHEVDQLLNQHGLPAQLLQLELTESTLMEDVEASVSEMQRLRQRGVSLAIDDFGTGYSSLSYLQRFPLDLLKIDRSFLQTQQTSHPQGTLTQAIIALGHGLGLKVVAEGVEYADQLETLRSLGCDYVQGYLISRPLAAEQLQPLLVEKADRRVTQDNPP